MREKRGLGEDISRLRERENQAWFDFVFRVSSQSGVISVQVWRYCVLGRM